MRKVFLADDVVTGSSHPWARLQAGLPSRSSRQPVRLFHPLSSDATASPAPRAKAGGARRDRTDDLMLAKHALSQLSYGPVNQKTNASRRSSTHLSSKGKRTRSSGGPGKT